MIIGKWKSESAREEFNKLAKKSAQLENEKDGEYADVDKEYDCIIEHLENRRNGLLDEHYED